MKSSIGFAFVMLFTLAMSGCVIDQKQPMGANHERTEGFSGYGTENVRPMEGPLSDIMVPDHTPKGLTDAGDIVANQDRYLSGERNVGMQGQGVNRSGSRIKTDRPGTLHDKPALRDRPYMVQKNNQAELIQQFPADIQTEIKTRLLNIETVTDVQLLKIDDDWIIGVESSESYKAKVERHVIAAIEDLVEPEHVRVVSDRSTINRIRAVNYGFNSGQPFEELGSTIAEVIKHLNGMFGGSAGEIEKQR